MVGPFVGIGYRHDGNTDKGHQSIRFPITIKEAGMYEIRIAYSPNANRATNVPVIIHAGGKSQAVKVNQRRRPEHGAFATIGKFAFPVGDAVVEISNAETDGHVIVDAIQLLPLK